MMFSKLILSPVLLLFFLLGVAIRVVGALLSWFFANATWAMGLGMGE